MLALIGFIVAITGTSAPTASPAATPAPTWHLTTRAGDEDYAITKLARAQYEAFAAGNIDTSQYSVTIPKDAIAQVRIGLSSLGEVKTVSFVKRLDVMGSSVYVYKFACANGAAVEQISIKDGKINGIYFRPAE